MSSTTILSVLAIFVAAVFFKELLFKLLSKGALKDVKKSLEKDKELNKEISELEMQSAKSEGKVEELENKIKERKDEDISENWHLNRGEK